MHILSLVRYVVYFLLLTICAYTDYKYGKIYNKNLIKYLLTFISLYLVEYLIVVFTRNVEINTLNADLINHLFGFFIAFLIGFIFYILGIFKGGDAKLLAVVGLAVGKEQIFTHLAIIIIVAGIVALYVLIKNKIFIKRFRRIYLYFKGMVLKRSFERYTTDEDDNIKFPMAIYILLGELISFLYMGLRG